MVISASVSTTGAVKRPSSALHDDCVGWENAPPMGISTSSSFNVPYSHYAMIYLDNMGKLKVSESASIREQNGTIFSSDVRTKFLEILGAKVGYQKPLIRRSSGMGASEYGYAYSSDLSHYRHGKRRKASAHDAALDVSFTEAFSDPVEELPACSATNMTGLEIGDTEKVLEYYENALKHFQQLNCRQIAKAFIKFIEPRKQVKHPYNGGRPRAGAPPGEKGDPEKTKPEWWPAGVVHKEPDHLKKDQRIRLLIHIVRKLGRFNITPDKLQEVAHDAKRQLKPNKMEVLDEIFRVRRLEERYERGEVDATTMVYVLNRDANAKGDKDSDTVSEADQRADMDELDDVDDGFLTPSTSAEQATSFTSMDSMAMPSQGRSMHMGPDRAQIFPYSESLSFGEQPRTDRPYYHATPEYSDEYPSHPMIKTSPGSSLISPNEAAFDYLAPPPFPASTAGEQMVSSTRPVSVPMQHPVSHYDSWTPSYRQNVFNPMGYGAANQTLHQPPMYQMPMTSASHAQDLPTGNGLPDMRGDKIEDLHPKGPSFRGGHLSHPHMMAAHHPTAA